MKQTTWIITFVTGQTEEVTSYSWQTAEILAQAKQIKKGNNYQVASIQEQP